MLRNSCPPPPPPLYPLLCWQLKPLSPTNTCLIATKGVCLSQQQHVSNGLVAQGAEEASQERRRAGTTASTSAPRLGPENGLSPQKRCVNLNSTYQTFTNRNVYPVGTNITQLCLHSHSLWQQCIMHPAWPLNGAFPPPFNIFG